MQNRSLGVRGLVFGGIMASLVVVCALVPFLSLFIPIPLVLVYVRYGGRAAVLTSIVAGLLTAMFVGPVQAFLITVPAGILPGLVFGYGFRRGLKPLTIGILAVAVFFLGYASEYVVTLAALTGGRDPMVVALEQPQVRQQLDTVMQGMQQLADMYAQQGQPAAAEQIRSMSADFAQDPITFAWSLLPMGVFMIGTLSTWVNYMLCRAILPRFGHPVPRPAPFSEFRLPMWVVWVFAIGTFGMAYAGTSVLKAAWWAKVIMNIMTPLTYIVLLAGVAAIYGYIRRKLNMAKGPAVAISLVISVIGMNLLILVALWDTIFDFRGLGHGLLKRPTQETP